MYKQAQFLRIVSFTLLLWIYLAGCAAQGPPGGGPVDKTGPELISSFPQNGATNIDPGSMVILNFSEVIEPRSAENSLVITPAMNRPPIVKARRKKVSIAFSEPLRENTTYILNFGRNIQDYQKNTTNKNIAVAFSTGDSLDQGQIMGQVFGIPEKQQAQVRAYRKSESFPDSILGSKPEYRTAVEQDGSFRLSNLAKGEYRLLAIASASTRITVIDENNLLAIQQADSVVIARRDDILSGINFKLDNFYLKPFHLQMASMQDEKIELTFSRPLDPEASVSVLPRIDGARIQSFWINQDNPRYLDIIADSIISGREYTVTIDGACDNKGERLTRNNSTVFVYSEIVDTLRPDIQSSQPSRGAKNVKLDTEICINFTEAMNRNLPMTSINLMSKDSVVVSFASHWRDGNSLVLTPATALESAMEYQLNMNCNAWTDIAGNRFQDSLKTISFTTVDANSFGSISGRIDVTTTPEGNLVINCFREKDRTPIRVKPSASGEYIVNSLLPGKYRFEIWEDQNGNGRWDQGSLIPFQAAERYRVYPDWINVRARWETAEVNWIY